MSKSPVRAAATEVTDMSPEPLLAAFQRYKGTWFDVTAGRVWPAGELRSTSDEISKTLAAKDVGFERVVLSASNSPFLICTLMALLELGASPVMTHAETPPLELERIAQRSGAAAILSQKHDTRAMTRVCGKSDVVNVLGQPTFSLTRIDRMAPMAHEFRGVPLHPTSGTTGMPKFAFRPAACAVADGVHYTRTLELDANHVIAALSPMTHVYAYGMCLVTPLLTDASVVVMENFQPRMVSTAIEELGVTILPAVPAMLDALLTGHRRPLTMPHLVFTAGAPLRHALARTWFEGTGSWPRSLYGTTETGLIALAATPEQAAESGSVGVPAAGVEARLGRAARNPEFDAVQVRSGSLMSGYLGTDGVDTTALTDGWYHTGDLARPGVGGALRLWGRETDIVNVGGLKVVPFEVEEVIADLPGVVAVKVYGKGATDQGQRLVAAVVGADGLIARDVAAHCRDRLAYFKQPSIIHMLDSLPLGPSGKVDIAQLP